MNTYLFILLNIISLTILIYAVYTSKNLLRLISKIFCSLCFLIIAISAYFNNPENSTYFLFIFIALIFSLLGDIFLGIESNNSKTNNFLFISGLISFSITHILYSICFINISQLYFIDFIFAILLTLILFSSIKFNKKIDLGSMLIPGLIYCFLISFMVCKVVSLLTTSNLNTIMLWLVISGAILFMISDYLLSFVVFSKNCPKTISALNLIAYYIGQILIALSILYVA